MVAGQRESGNSGHGDVAGIDEGTQRIVVAGEISSQLADGGVVGDGGGQVAFGGG